MTTTELLARIHAETVKELASVKRGKKSTTSRKWLERRVKEGEATITKMQASN